MPELWSSLRTWTGVVRKNRPHTYAGGDKGRQHAAPCQLRLVHTRCGSAKHAESVGSRHCHSAPLGLSGGTAGTAAPLVCILVPAERSRCCRGHARKRTSCSCSSVRHDQKHTRPLLTPDLKRSRCSQTEPSRAYYFPRGLRHGCWSPCDDGRARWQQSMTRDQIWPAPIMRRR